MTANTVRMTQPVDTLVDKYELHKLWPYDTVERLKNVLAASEYGVVAGVSGKICSGKDTVADLLADRLPTEAYRFSFATPVREELRQLVKAWREGSALPWFCADVPVADLNRVYDLVKPFLDADNIEQLSVMRPLMQMWGTDVRRKQDENFWVKRTIWHILETAERHPGAITVLSDVRFPNEADMVLDFAGVLLRLEVPEQVRRQRALSRDGYVSDEANEHSSETSLDNYRDFTIVAHGDMDAENVVSEMVAWMQKDTDDDLVAEADVYDDTEAADA